MASKRMFRLDVLDTDAFLDMPLSAQALYFHLCLRADDDGFIGSPKRITSLIGANGDDLRLLIAKRFVLEFDNGVIVIKHWRMHNTLSANRYHETNYTSEKEQLLLKQNGAYSLSEGVPISDAHLIEMSKRQVVDERKTNNRRAIDEQKTSNRRTKDEQKTNAVLDIDKDKRKSRGIENPKDIEMVNDIEGSKVYNVEFALDDAEIYSRIIGYLNEKTGRRYNPNTKQMIGFVNARLKEGYTEDDFRKVIDNKCAEWIGTEQEQFLRPSTLFAPSHFDEYLNQGIVKRKPQTNDEKSEQMFADVDRWAEG